MNIRPLESLTKEEKMNIRPLESLTKEELIELIRHERDHCEDILHMVPDGWKLVPVEPTDEMKKAGCQVPLNKAARHNACYKAMLASAPTIKDSLLAKPTDTEMLDWLVENEQTIEYVEDTGCFEVWIDTCRHEGKTARDAISKAMRGDK